MYLRVAGGDGREGKGSRYVRKGIEAGPKESQLKFLWFFLVVQWLNRCCHPAQGGSVVNNPPANAGDARDAGLIPGLGRFPGEENGNPLQVC